MNKKSSHETLRSISLQDEDLLDLMVRIAQSPSEWDRIQQVLSQLGKTEKPTKKEEAQNKTQLIPNSSNSFDSEHGHSTSEVSSVSSHPSTVNIDYEESADYQSSKEKPTKDTDSGWPDFKEAILKKVKKPGRISDSFLQNDLFGNDWFDTSWSALVEEENDQESHPQNMNTKSAAVSFVKLNISESASDKMSNDVRKTTYSSNNMFDSPTRQDAPAHGEDYAEGLSHRMPRPVFVYHRVTTSPQERKSNNAIIAVSVARRDQEAPSSAPSNNQSTQRIKVNLEDSFKRNFDRHRSKERAESLAKPVSPGHVRHHTHSHH